MSSRSSTATSSLRVRSSPSATACAGRWACSACRWAACSPFLRHGFGDRLLGAITHLDISEFARSYGGMVAPAAMALVDKCFGVGFVERNVPAAFAGYAPGLRMLGRLGDAADAEVSAMNPASYLANAGDRPVRLLVGEDDPVVKYAQVQRLAAKLPNGAAYVVPGLTHGLAQAGGPDFVQHVRFFVTSQLGDWRNS
eukprot:TRINITY_DN2070_c0_g1_i2.p2 TRINITY_DN2070_c0_g1~~TRINITY_DN2070_c0_g1_i2.p2  ORF type:complete len:197 (-),score=45.44 TRINITY_DN2070_c0_g1_i2:273-863(-)